MGEDFFMKGLELLFWPIWIVGGWVWIENRPLMVALVLDLEMQLRRRLCNKYNSWMKTLKHRHNLKENYPDRYNIWYCQYFKEKKPVRIHNLLLTLLNASAILHTYHKGRKWVEGIRLSPGKLSLGIISAVLSNPSQIQISTLNVKSQQSTYHSPHIPPLNYQVFLLRWKVFLGSSVFQV